MVDGDPENGCLILFIVYPRRDLQNLFKHTGLQIKRPTWYKLHIKIYL